MCHEAPRVIAASRSKWLFLRPRYRTPLHLEESLHKRDSAGTRHTEIDSHLCRRILPEETVVIERDDQRIALRRIPASADPGIAPPNYFADDYSREEITELNALAAQAPQVPLP